jgi:alkylation response protein AidB-like acyl-CoA dehydrogenase
MPHTTIDSPCSPELDRLCDRLAEASARLSAPDAWPVEQLRWCGESGVYRWFFPAEYGGLEWSAADIYRGYLRLSAACLTTTFVITQRMGACHRMLASRSIECQHWLPGLLDGSIFATLGISHLTTSRQHVAAVLRAEPSGDGYLLDGYCPWVTGGGQADLLVIGATLGDGRQIMAVVDTKSAGVQAGEHIELMALTASQTGMVKFSQTQIPESFVLAGPVENVMKQGGEGGAGGLQTSILATGLAGTAVRYLTQEATKRPNMKRVADEFRQQLDLLERELLAAADGSTDHTSEKLRTRANSLVLRATQAAMTAAKGAGYTQQHPVGRWCREALFFLVWSCPEPVLFANLCELAQLCD